jgi:N-acylneuraminate cytidylyltransferase/CMP-N,N'-diacetyllegionaminic acid synthase
MKIIAVIPARAGSKRLPGKNVKMLGEHPLIAWTIRAALQSSGVSDVVVTTDDPQAAEIAQRYGATVPGMRPGHLSTDTATSVDVVRYVVDQYEASNGPVQGVLLLQPTSPFRTVESIDKAIELFAASPLRPVVSVSPASAHPAWCFKVESGSMQPFMGWEQVARRSQDLEPAYTLNGAIYLIAPDVLRRHDGFVFEGAVPLVMDQSEESLDIDTVDDWSEAQRVLESLKR